MMKLRPAANAKLPWNDLNEYSKSFQAANVRLALFFKRKTTEKGIQQDFSPKPVRIGLRQTR